MKFKNISGETLRIQINAGQTKAGTPFCEWRNIRAGETKDIQNDAIKGAYRNVKMRPVTEEASELAKEEVAESPAEIIKEEVAPVSEPSKRSRGRPSRKLLRL
jgi:hypothetical protein